MLPLSSLVLYAWPWPRVFSRTSREGLGLGLDTSGPRLLPQYPGHVVAVRVCSAYTHGVVTVCHFLLRNVSRTYITLHYITQVT